MQPPWLLHSLCVLHACSAIVLQPPLPLHEFFCAQPLSPDLQPPLFLQVFSALQACLSAATWLALCFGSAGFVQDVRVAVPSSRPATAAERSADLDFFMRVTLRGMG